MTAETKGAIDTRRSHSFVSFGVKGNKQRTCE